MTASSRGARSLWPLWLSCFVFFAGMTSLWPVLPFLALRLGASPWQLGVFVAALPATGWLSALVVGRLSDHYSRLSLLLVVQLFAIIFHACYALAPTLMALFIVRLAHGIGGALMGGLQGYVADHLPKGERSRGLAILGMMFGCGLISGVLMTSVVLAQWDWPITQIPLLGSALMFVAWLINILLLPSARRARHKIDTPVPPLHWPSLTPLLAIFAALQLGFTGVEATLGLWLEEAYSLGASELGFLLGSAAFANILGHGLVGAWHRVISGKRLALSAMIFVLAGSLVVIAHANLLWVYSGMFLIGFGIGVFMPTQQNLITRYAEQSQGLALGVNQSLYQGARIFGPIIAGLCYQHTVMISPFIFLGLMSLAGVFYGSIRWPD